MFFLYSKLVKQPWLYTSLCQASGIACLISYNAGMLPGPAHLVKYYTHGTFSLSQCLAAELVLEHPENKSCYEDCS